MTSQVLRGFPPVYHGTLCSGALESGLSHLVYRGLSLCGPLFHHMQNGDYCTCTPELTGLLRSLWGGAGASVSWATQSSSLLGPLSLSNLSLCHWTSL